MSPSINSNHILVDFRTVFLVILILFSIEAFLLWRLCEFAVLALSNFLKVLVLLFIFGDVFMLDDSDFLLKRGSLNLLNLLLSEVTVYNYLPSILAILCRFAIVLYLPSFKSRLCLSSKGPSSLGHPANYLNLLLSLPLSGDVSSFICIYSL